jgi:hypothetical protein
MFAMFDPGRDLRRLREIHGVDCELRRDGRPVPVSDDAVAALRAGERRALFDISLGCRVPDDDAQPLDARFAAWAMKIKRTRSSRERTKLLMELLIGK